MRSNKSCLKGLIVYEVILGSKGYQFYYGRVHKTLFLAENYNVPLKPCNSFDNKIRSLPLRLVWK